MMLVTIDQLYLRLRRIIDEDQAVQEITLASGVVGGYCNLVSLEQIEDDEIVLRGSYSGVLHLPGGPVTEVSEVLVDGTAVSDHWLVKDDLYRGRPGGVDEAPLRAQGSWVGPDVEVAITYTHGFATVPFDIQAVVLGMAARTWSNPAGVRQQVIDGYSVTWTNGVLAPEDMRSLRRYHRVAHTADVS